MKKLYFMIFLLSVHVVASFAQHITGKIVEEESLQVLMNANVRILTLDEEIAGEAYTDSKGLFKIGIPVDSCVLSVNFPGFRHLNLFIKKENQRDIELGEIVLYKDDISVNLDEVTVSADRVRHEMDRLIVFPSPVQVQASAGGLDLLQHLQLPGLFVDPVNQKIQIYGSDQVIYRINGVTASLEQISTLQPDQIKRIDYHQNPSIRELESGSGVINVILKEVTNGTYAYVNSMGSLTTGFINGNTSLKTVFNNSELSVDYIVSWRDYSQRWSREEESYYGPGKNIEYLKEGQYAPFGYLSQQINVGYTYKNEKDIFSVKFLNTIFDSHDRNKMDISGLNNNGEVHFFRDIRSKQNIYLPSVDLYYIRKIDEESGFEGNLVGAYTKTDYDRSLVDDYGTWNERVDNLTDGNSKSIILEGLYYNKKSRVDYNFGIKGNYNYAKSTYNKTDEIEMSQTQLYPYTSVEGKIRNISYSLGTGLNFFHMDDKNETRTYYKNLTTFSLFYNHSKWNIRNFFQFTPSYPSLSQLSDIVQVQDSLMIIKGNPQLKPSQTLSDRINFSYIVTDKISTTASLFLSKTFDSMRSHYYYEASSGYFVTQRVNLKSEKQVGLNGEVRGQSLFNFLSLTLGVNWDKYQSRTEDAVYDFDNFYWYIFANAQYKHFSLDMAYYKPSKDLAGQIVYLNENYSSVSLNYKKNHLSLRAGLMYLFSSGAKYGTRRMSDVVPSEKYVYIKNNANMFYIGFSYDISWGKSVFNVNKHLRNAGGGDAVLRIQDN